MYTQSVASDRKHAGCIADLLESSVEVIIIIIIIITFCLSSAFGRLFGTQAHETADIRSQLNVHMV